LALRPPPCPPVAACRRGARQDVTLDLSALRAAEASTCLRAVRATQHVGTMLRISSTSGRPDRSTAVERR